MIIEDKIEFRLYVCEDCGKESMFQIGIPVFCATCGSKNMTVKITTQPTKTKQDEIIFPEASPFLDHKISLLHEDLSSTITDNHDAVEKKIPNLANPWFQKPLGKIMNTSQNKNDSPLTFRQLDEKEKFSIYGIHCRIENKRKNCSIWCKRSVLAFKAKGKIISHQGILYYVKLIHDKFSLYNLQWNQNQWIIGKRILMISQNASNDLYQTLKNSDFEKQIQDIFEGNRTEDCKVLVNGKWYNNSGDFIDEVPESSSNGDDSVNQIDEFSEPKNLDKEQYQEVQYFLALSKNKKMKGIIDLLESGKATKFGAVNFLRYLILSADEASLYTAFKLVGCSKICRRYFPQDYEMKDIENALKSISHLPLLQTTKEWLCRIQLSKKCPFNKANKKIDISSLSYEKFLVLFDVYKQNFSKSIKNDTKSKKSKKEEEYDQASSAGMRNSYFVNVDPIQKDQKYTDLEYGLLDT